MRTIRGPHAGVLPVSEHDMLAAISDKRGKPRCPAPGTPRVAPVLWT